MSLQNFDLVDAVASIVVDLNAMTGIATGSHRTRGSPSLDVNRGQSGSFIAWVRHSKHPRFAAAAPIPEIR